MSSILYDTTALKAALESGLTTVRLTTTAIHLQQFFTAKAIRGR